MGILDKFKCKKSTAPAEQHEFADPADQAAWDKGGHHGMPQEEANGIEPVEDEADLSDIVQDDRVEVGIPQDLTVGKETTARKFVFLGIGLLAVGLTVAGLINFAGSDTEQSDDQVKTDEQTAGNSQPKDFNKDKEKLALARAASEPEMVEAASAASAPAASAASAVPTASPTPAPAATEQTESTPVTANPADSIRKRRLSGSVLVGLSGSGGSDDAGGADNEGETTDQPTAVGSSASPSGGGLPGSEDTDEDKPARGGSFASRLNPTQTASVSAQQRGDLTYLLTKGTHIRCGLDTRIITTQPGFTRCIVSKDVYSANGKVLLIERGSTIIGEQTSALLQGQARVFVLWNELETPSGVKVSLSSPGSGQLGEAGHGAYVNYHFWQRFGGAMMISLISDLGENLSGRKGTSGNNNQITYEHSSEAAQEMAAEALKNSINIPPTGTINQGTVLNIMVARDVNFNKVYERVDTDPLVAY